MSSSHSLQDRASKRNMDASAGGRPPAARRPKHTRMHALLIVLPPATRDYAIHLDPSCLTRRSSAGLGRQRLRCTIAGLKVICSGRWNVRVAVSHRKLLRYYCRHVTYRNTQSQ